MEKDKVTGPVLAIDSVSRQGSVSLINGSSVLATSSEASGNPARAEELILVINDVLETCKMTLEDLTGIAVATGPGSYSGIRIGMATAAGLSSARRIPAFGVSLLEGLAMTLDSGSVMTAVRAGKHDIAYQEFVVIDREPRPVAPPVQDSEKNFVSMLDAGKRVVACDSELGKDLTDMLPDDIELLDAGFGLASLVGLFATRFPDRSPLQPFYLRNIGHTAAGF